MDYWVGTKEVIEAADKQVLEVLLDIPAYHGDELIPREDRRLTNWALPAQTKDGQWFIAAYDGVEPAGVTLVDTVKLPEDQE